MFDSKLIDINSHGTRRRRLAGSASVLAMMTVALVANAQSAGAADCGSIQSNAAVCTGSATPGNGNFTNSGTIYSLYDGGPDPAISKPGVFVGSAVTLGTFTNTNLGVIGGLPPGSPQNLSDETGVKVAGSIGTLSNTGTITSQDAEAIVVESTGIIGLLSNSGLIFSASTTAISNAGSIGTLSNSGTIQNKYEYGIENSGTISSLTNTNFIFGSSTAIRNIAGGTIGSLVNSGTIGGLTKGGTGIINRGGIGSLSNSGSILGTSSGIANYNATIGTLSNLGIIDVGTESSGYGISNTGTGIIGTLINGQGGNSSGPAQTALTYKGNLPGTYLEHISSTTHYGQLAVTEGVGSIGTFGIAEGSTLTSGTVTYGSVFTGVTTVGTLTTGTLEGTFASGSRLYDWDLVSSASGIWDLIVTSLITAPASVDTVAVNLTDGAASYAQQFDGSRVIMHLSEMRKKENRTVASAGAPSIVPTADVISEGSQDGDTASMSTRMNDSSLFAIIRGAWVDYNATGENEAYSVDAAGVTFGGEHAFDEIDATLGIFGSFSQTNSEGSNSSDEVDNFGAGLYGNKELGGNIWLDSYVAYYTHKHDISRDLDGDSYSADPDGKTFSGYARLSYAGLEVQDMLSFTPYVSLNYVSQSTDGYKEDGDGGSALEVDEDSTSNWLSSAGATLEASLPAGDSLMLLPKVDAAWVHAFEDGEREVDTNFVGAPDSYATVISGQDQDYVSLALSLGVQMNDRLTVTMDYATQLMNDDVDNMTELRLEANVKF